MTGSATNLIARLERELRDIWTVPEEPGSIPMSRVCTMNLVVVSGAADLRDRYTPVVDEVTASIPARAIVASVETDATGPALEGSATAVCSLDAGRKVCSERVLLAAQGKGCARVASAIESLLVPEIPTALVWLGRVEVDDPVFEDIARHADRVLLDSEYTSLASLLHVTKWAREHDRPLKVADLAWTRLSPWQELLARFFDNAPVQHLAWRITRVHIEQASERGARLGSEPALLLGWMATRLGWKAHGAGSPLRFERPDGGVVTVELGSVPQLEGVAPLALSVVRVEAAAEDGAAMRGTVSRELADVVLWTLDVAPGHGAEQRVRLGPNKAAKWLERTLHRRAEDPAFDEAVAFAEQLVDDGLTVGRGAERA